jgi:hypothetical protein
MTTLDAEIILLRNRLAKTDLKFNALASTDFIEQFEQDNEVILPTEYRLFIQHIGNGGDGPPFYGIEPLGYDERWLTFENIGKPFPFAEQWIWEDDVVENVELKNKVFDGNLYLGTDGCGMNWVLIISGVQRGFIWQLSDVGISPCKPAMTFLQWFNKWLDYDKSSECPYWWTD